MRMARAPTLTAKPPLKAMALHPSVERRAGQAKSGRGVGDVAVVERQGALDGPSLQGVEVEVCGAFAPLPGQGDGGGETRLQRFVAPRLENEICAAALQRLHG